MKGAKARLSLQRPVGGIKVAYKLNEERQREEGLLNYSAHLRTTSPIDRDESDAYAALKLIVGNLRSPGRLVRQVRDRTLPAGIGTLTMNLVKGSPEVAQAIYYEAFRKPNRFQWVTPACFDVTAHTFKARRPEMLKRRMMHFAQVAEKLPKVFLPTFGPFEVFQKVGE